MPSSSPWHCSSLPVSIGAGPSWEEPVSDCAWLCRPSLLPGGMLVAAGALLAGPATRRERLERSLALGALDDRHPVSLGGAQRPGSRRARSGPPRTAVTPWHWANNEPYYRDVLGGSPGAVWSGNDQWLWWDSVNRATAGMTEPGQTGISATWSSGQCADQPVTFLRACLDRQTRFWSLAPAGAVYSRGIRWATAAWTLPLWIALAMGLVQPGLWRWPRVAAPLMVAGLRAVHAFYWTDMRMRAPIVPAIALIAAAAELPPGATDRPSTVIAMPSRPPDGHVLRRRRGVSRAGG